MTRDPTERRGPGGWLRSLFHHKAHVEEPVAPPTDENGPPEPRWRVIGCSVRGAAHARTGLPNQDAILWTPESGEGPPLVVAVADGHGSARCFRSDRGSRFAVAAAMAALEPLLDGQNDANNLSAVKRIADESMPLDLLRNWDALIDADLAGERFSDAELDALEAGQGQEARRAVEKAPRLAYGSTVLVAALTDTFLLYLQLGDGDILTVSPSGEVERPLPADPRLFANETTSLAAGMAQRDARVALAPVSPSPPALIVLSTDGYANSFQTDHDFLLVGPDLLSLLREDGVSGVSAQLESWLREASASGSGDDVTLALACRLDALTAFNRHTPSEVAGEAVRAAMAEAADEAAAPAARDTFEQ